MSLSLLEKDRMITLEGERVKLVPLTMDHLDGFCEIGLDRRLWNNIIKPVTNREEMREYIQEAVDNREKGQQVPFAIILKDTGEPVGCTRYGTIHPQFRRIEIGWTWITPSWQRSYVNTETKFLLFEYAFETLKCIRVELETDSINTQSQNAMLRIGLKKEGVLRSHQIAHDGRIRDTVYFSIIASEWQEKKAYLQTLLSR